MNCWYTNTLIVSTFISLLTCMVSSTCFVDGYLYSIDYSYLLTKPPIFHPFIDVELTPSDVEKTKLLNELYWHPDNVIIDYGKIEKRVIYNLFHGYGKEKDRYIIHEARDFSGFGNQVSSLVGNIALALATGRRLRIFPCNYFKETNSSLNQLVISRDEANSLGAKLYKLENTKIHPYMQLIPSKTFNEIFPEKNIIIYCNQDTSIFLPSIVNANRNLKMIGLFDIGNNYHFLLYRLVIQPSNKINSEILSILHNPDMKHCIGVQMRTGGELADKWEKHKFLSKARVNEYARSINEKYKNNEAIYLSTDSNKVINIVKKRMKNHKVITSTQFSIGHSSLSKHNQGLKRAIVDMIVTSHCQPLYVTYGSSFGIAINFLSYNTETTIMSH